MAVEEDMGASANINTTGKHTHEVHDTGLCVVRVHDVSK